MFSVVIRIKTNPQVHVAVADLILTMYMRTLRMYKCTCTCVHGIAVTEVATMLNC